MSRRDCISFFYNVFSISYDIALAFALFIWYNCDSKDMEADMELCELTEYGVFDTKLAFPGNVMHVFGKDTQVNLEA